MVVALVKEGAKIFSIAFYKTIRSLSSSNIMTEDEALKILNVKNNNELYKNFNKLYELNSKKNNGSSYLQSRIKNAYDFITIEKNLKPNPV